MKKRNILFISIMLVAISAIAQKQFILESPDGKLRADITVGKVIEYQVSHKGDLMLDKSPLSMTLGDGQSFGIEPRLSGSSTKTVNKKIDAPIYKRSEIIENYNELSLKFKDNYNIIFRAYNDGVAYRFETTLKKPFIVESEQAVFNFPADSKAYIPYVKNKKNSLEA